MMGAGDEMAEEEMDDTEGDMEDDDAPLGDEEEESESW